MSRYLLGVRNASTSATNFSRCIVKVNRCPPSNRGLPWNRKT